jgi:hypothetical protein
LPSLASRRIIRFEAAQHGYEQSLQNLTQVSLQTDTVFSDGGGARQLGSMTGSVSAGYVVELAVPVSTA